MQDTPSSASTSRHSFGMPAGISSAAAAAAAAKTLHVRFMGVGEDKNGRSMYVSKKLLSVPGSALAATTLAGAHQHHTPQTLTHLPGFTSMSHHPTIGSTMGHHFSTSTDLGPDGGGTTTTESSESETENNSTLLEDEIVTSSKFLLLIDQLSLDQKRHLTIKDIGIILDRLSSKILDVERLDRESEATDCFNWTIKATIRGDALRELGVIYNGNYYAISEHPSYSTIASSSSMTTITAAAAAAATTTASTTTTPAMLKQTRAQVHSSGMMTMTTSTAAAATSSTTRDEFEEEDMRL